MKLHLLFFHILIAHFSLLTAAADDSQRVENGEVVVQEAAVKITSRLNEGTNNETVLKTVSQKSRVISKNTIQQGGRNVTMQEVQAPVRVKPVELEVAHELSSKETEAFSKQAGNILAQHFVGVSATIYDGRATHLKIWNHDGELRDPVEAWSNVDWNYFDGFTSLVGLDQSFILILFPSNSSIKTLRRDQRKNPQIIVPKIPKELPQIKDGRARYVVVNYDETNNKGALDFLEAIHEFYETEQTSIVKAYWKRENQRKLRAEELRKNPPKPEDIEILFWNNDLNK